MGSAAEKTEQATERRRRKEREKGNIAKSQDLNSALMATAGVALLGMMATGIMDKIKVLLFETFTHLNPKDITTQDIFLIFMPAAQTTAQILLPFLLTLMLAALFIIRSQVGHVFAKEKFKLDFSNISPSRIMQSAKKFFNPVDPKNLVELVKSVLKLVIVGSCGFSAVNGRKEELFGLFGMEINSALLVIGSILSKMLINMCLAMIVIGFLDRKFQDYQYEKSIKMSKQEVKDEYKDTEGDPKIKAKIRSIQMQMAQQRMMAAIPTADVVVTNPTHFAVAIKYDKLKAPAPMIVAKGVDFVAFKIREVAQNNNIPIVENPPLARALYKLVPIDGIIPSDMFVAVAEVLAYVYNKDKNS